MKSSPNLEGLWWTCEKQKAGTLPSHFSEFDILRGEEEKGDFLDQALLVQIQAKLKCLKLKSSSKQATRGKNTIFKL